MLCCRDPMELMEQQLRCGVPPVRLYEHLAMTSPAAAAAALQQQHDSSGGPAQQHPAHPLSPWLTSPTSAAAALLYGSRGGTPSPYSPGPPAGFPYPGLSWSWQPAPVAMISRRSSPSSVSAGGVRYAPYPTPTSTPPPPLRARPATPN